MDQTLITVPWYAFIAFVDSPSQNIDQAFIWIEKIEPEPGTEYLRREETRRENKMRGEGGEEGDEA